MGNIRIIPLYSWHHASWDKEPDIPEAAINSEKGRYSAQGVSTVIAIICRRISLRKSLHDMIWYFAGKRDTFCMQFNAATDFHLCKFPQFELGDEPLVGPAGAIN